MTKRVREVVWLWSWLIASDEDVTIGETGAGIGATASGNMDGNGAVLGGELAGMFTECSAAGAVVFVFSVGDGSNRGVAGVSPDREIAERFSFTAANSANRDSTMLADGFVTASVRSGGGGGVPELGPFTLLTGAAGASCARCSGSGSAELIVARISAARFSSLTATGDGWLAAFSRSRLMVLVDLGSAFDMVILPRHSATQLA